MTFAVSAAAAVIHKWVDDQGITHYSDEPPSAIDTPVTRIDLPETESIQSDTENDYYSIANQWARLHQERLEIEKLRQAERQESAQKPSVTNVYIEDEDDGYGRIAVHLKPYYRKGKRKHFKEAKRGHFKRADHRQYTYRSHQREYPPGLHPSRRGLSGYKSFY